MSADQPDTTEETSSEAAQERTRMAFGNFPAAMQRHEPKNRNEATRQECEVLEPKWQHPKLIQDTKTKYVRPVFVIYLYTKTIDRANLRRLVRYLETIELSLI